jgi:hypothetical protein
MRPGGIIDTDDAKGIQMIQYPPAIVDAFTEVEASDSRAQRRTGANQLVTQGTAPSQGQLGRTSAGVSTAVGALGARISYWMDQITDLMFVPFLECLHEMNRLYLPEDEITDILEKELKEEFTGDPLDIKNANLRFQILAGSKLRARMAMLQLAPELVQLLQLAPVLDSISDQQKKVDWVNFIQSLLDATDWPGAQKFIVDMTQEDKQRQQQKSQAAMQTSQIALKHASAMDEIEQKARGQAGVHIIRGLIEHMDPLNRTAALQQLKDLMAPPGQEEGGGDQTQPPQSNQMGGGGGGTAMGNL